MEYDVLGSVENDLKLVAIDCIEQTAIPIAATWFPDLSNESFIITANDEVHMIHKEYMYMYLYINGRICAHYLLDGNTTYFDFFASRV